MRSSVKDGGTTDFPLGVIKSLRLFNSLLTMPLAAAAPRLPRDGVELRLAVAAALLDDDARNGVDFRLAALGGFPDDDRDGLDLRLLELFEDVRWRFAFGAAVAA